MIHALISLQWSFEFSALFLHGIKSIYTFGKKFAINSCNWNCLSMKNWKACYQNCELHGENLDHWNPYDALLSHGFLLFCTVWNVHARTFIFPFHVWFLFHKRHIYKLIDNKKAGNLIFPANARSLKSHYIHACWERKLCK